jgi:hypothetical protein
MTLNYLNPKELNGYSQVGTEFDMGNLQNIAVTQPYFALKNLRWIDDYIYADFSAELLEPDEIMPITAAEVGRHMAIMGSVAMAAANSKKEQHYYLATDATIIRRSNKESFDRNVIGRIKTESIDKRNGLTTGSLFDVEMNKLFDVEVKYKVLHHSLFEKMFAQYKMETNENLDYNPYQESVAFNSLSLGIKNCTGSIGKILPEHCAGHFANYPAFPVARMGTAMGKIAGEHFKFLHPGKTEKYTIGRADLHAEQLLFAGKEVHFRTEIEESTTQVKGMVIKVTAFTNELPSVAESLLHFYF